MAFPLALILPALIPVLSDGLRGVINRLTGGAGANPANVKEAIELLQAQAAHARAMAELDRPAGNISRWVSDLRASFRYISAGIFVLAPYVILTANAYGAGIPSTFVEASFQGHDAAFSFIFGARMYAYLKK